MKYFELTADKEITNPIRIQKLQGSVYKKGISAEGICGDSNACRRLF